MRRGVWSRRWKKVRVAIQWTLDLVFSRQIEQFLTLKDLEQIEQLAAQLSASRSDASPPIGQDSERTRKTEVGSQILTQG